MGETSPLDGKLEPEAKDGCSSPSEAALVSMAVSLKRIADELAGIESRLGLIDTLFQVGNPHQ